MTDTRPPPVAIGDLHDPDTERVVVSSHTHLPGPAIFSAPRRLCVSAPSNHPGETTEAGFPAIPTSG